MVTKIPNENKIPKDSRRREGNTGMSDTSVTAQVRLAVKALAKWSTDQKDEKQSSKKKQLFDQDSQSLFVFGVTKRIYEHKKIQYIHIQLPHPYRDPKTTSICLFTKDLSREKWDPDVDKDARQFKEYLDFEKQVEGIDQIISLRQLKREYKTFEAKRKLCSAYDLFMVDDRVTGQISRNLGKAFHAAKKQPFPIKISSGEVSDRVEKAYGKVTLLIKPKQTFSLKLGNLTQSVSELSANFDSFCAALKEKLPGGWPNVRSMYLHAGNNSPKLPIHVSLESNNFVTLPKPPKKRASAEEGELTTLEHGETVKVYPDGRVYILDKTGKEITRHGNKVKKRKTGKRKSDRIKEEPKIKKRKVKTEVKEPKFEFKTVDQL